ncbi:MAG: hypothetical protein P4L71_14405 [Acetobacteraceae bacterium]|nr:hypothetical protein [Acetobacteraceae bacterium]
MAETVVALPAAPIAGQNAPSSSGGEGECSSVSLTRATLGRLLGALASRPGPVPKYRYPSAGTLYPVQTYLVLGRTLGDLAAGSYYHDPAAHALVKLSAEAPLAPDGTTPDALLLLVAQRAAIAPIYGEQANAFCLLEAGYMHQALCDAAAGLPLRDAGDPAAHLALASACMLDADHMPLACWAVGENA